MTTTVTKCPSDPIDVVTPSLFEYITEGPSKGEIVLVSGFDQATVVHSVNTNYPLGSVYKNWKAGACKSSWSLITQPISITFNH